MPNPPESAPKIAASKRLIQLFTAILVVCLLAGLRAPAPSSDFKTQIFGKLPVLQGGRIKPYDTVARTSLLMLSGKQRLKIAGQGARSAIDWLLDMLFSAPKADNYNVFRIDDPDVLGLIGIEQNTRTLFSYREIFPYLSEIQRQALRADQIESSARSRFETAILNLQNRAALYQHLQNSLEPAGSSASAAALESLVAPAEASESSAALQAAKVAQRYQQLMSLTEFRAFPEDDAAKNDNAWINVSKLVQRSLAAKKLNPDLLAFARLADAWRAGNASEFNTQVEEIQRSFATRLPKIVSHVGYETVFNYFEPFYKSMIVYVLVVLLAVMYWLTGRETLNGLAYNYLIVGLIVHSAGLFSRMWLQGRPPVTNLYSSAVFVGWGAVLFGAVAERLYRSGMLSVMAGSIGFVTLIIAHHLALQGDTMEMMRAVLDSNFWLATHVVCITIGYSATLISGFTGVIYLLRRTFDRSWNAKTAEELGKVLYGLLCFAALLSFLGTVLGGIWADQSWGRFWGWDPKENGAMLIVLWTLLVLHAKAGRLVGLTGMMTLAVFGNIVTALAWFGVNMLNIGLHSYGYMDKTLSWLVIFVIFQLAIMTLALFPPRAPLVP